MAASVLDCSEKKRKKIVLLEVLVGVSITNYCIIQLHYVECK